MNDAFLAHPPSRASIWLRAARLYAIGLTIAPVLVGACLAQAMTGQMNLPAVLVALLGAILIQTGTNMHNDAADSDRGGDGPDRVGPPRITAQGLLSSTAVKRGAAACYVLAAAAGIYLIHVGGWPILLLGVLSIICGWAYTGGPWPIAYSPLGEVFVVLFFGLGAVCGTYWLCTSTIDLASILAGLAMGLFAAAVLLVNNFRDAVADARVGRHTLAICLGRAAALRFYAAFMLAPFALLPMLGAHLPGGHVWPTFLAMPLAFLMIHRLATRAPGSGLTAVLGQTAHTQAAFAVLLCAGILS
jgi:1,4-dihydroxy-2-naphthoate octaprenyltransferase